MVEFLAESWIWLAIALLLGLLTAWWLWSKPTASDSDVQSSIGSGLMDSVTDTVSKTASGAVDVTKKAADTTVSTAKSSADTAGSAAKATVKKTTSTAKKAASTTKKTATKATTKKPAAKKTTAKAAPKTAAKKPAVKKTTAKAAPKAAPKTAVKKPAAKKPAAKPAAKKAAKTVIPNDLELLKGVGPKLNGLLNSLGVTTFDQIANWKAADIRDVDSKLGSFAGRISRDNWVDQAKLLSKGDVKGFEKKYGSLGAEIKK